MNTSGQIEHVDPSTVRIATNIRTTVPLEAEFLDSIRANGVLQPVTAYRVGEDLHVQYGQRRTRAAQQVGLATIPVYVVTVDDADDAQRIIEQLVENEQRESLTATDRVQAWKQLEIEGLSATQIAKRTGTKRETVKTGLTVAASAIGAGLLTTTPLTLDQAATLLEFEDDTALVEELTSIAAERPGYFPVAVQRARDERERARLCAAARESEAAKGHTVLDSAPAWGSSAYHPLYALTTADGKRVTADDVQGKEGVCVYVRAYNDVTIDYFVTDPAALGYVSTHTGTSNQGPMTDEEKAQRKELIANNKEWDAATVVRIEWVTNLISRKALPKDAANVTASLLTTACGLVATTMSRGNSTAKTFLGLENGYADVLPGYVDNHPARAGHVTLALVFGGIEQTMSRESWRYPRHDVAAYLQALQAWGYALSPVESVAAQLSELTA